MKTNAVYNHKEAEEQMESLMFNCINMTQRDEAFILINIDPRLLNTALRRHHATLTIEEITHHFKGAKIFSKLDAGLYILTLNHS